MDVYLALGSNLGDREAYLTAGIRGLATIGVEIVRTASIYATEPKDVTDQPWFLNTAVLGSTSLSARGLLAACLRIEAEYGRIRDRSKSPRTLDIDLIFYEDEIIRESDLIVPHPRFAERRFVLEPLAEIAPDFKDPVSGKSVRQLLAETNDSGVVAVTDGTDTPFGKSGKSPI
jgi:2-amino-4-hydroxy-6-hydroxymethyldihydropteridine diphosphokinase